MKNIKEKKYSVLFLISKFSFIFVLVFSIMTPFVFVSADPTTSTTATTTSGPTTGTTGVTVDAGIKNPIPSITDLPTFIEWTINAILVIGIPLLVLAIIYAGFLYVKAQGNSGELEVAHRTLLYTVIGGFLLLGAFVIAKAIGTTVDDIKSTT